MCRHNAAELVAAAYYLSGKLMKDGNLGENLSLDFGVEFDKVKNLAKKMFVFLCDEKNSKLSSCRRKFEQSKYEKVSGLELDMVVDIR